jgi:hypothetical protein
MMRIAEELLIDSSEVCGSKAGLVDEHLEAQFAIGGETRLA